MGVLPEWRGLPDFDLEFTDSLREDRYVRYSIHFLVADEVIAAIASRIFFSNSPAGDKNFSAEDVKVGIESASKVYPPKICV